MSLPHIASTRINNVHFRQPDDSRFNIYHSMESYHRENRGFPSRQHARAALALKPDPVKKTPFRYRLPPPDYRPQNPNATDVWRRSSVDPLHDPLPSSKRGFSHAHMSSTEYTSYGTISGGKKTKTRTHRGKKKADNAGIGRKSPEAFVLPKIKSCGMVCGAETDHPSLCLDVLPVSRPAAVVRTPRSNSSLGRADSACADRLPPVSTRSGVVQYAEHYGEQWTEYLTLLRQRVRARHNNQPRNDAGSTDGPAWENNLLTASTVIDTDSYNLYARTAPTGKQRRRCTNKPSNVQT